MDSVAEEVVMSMIAVWLSGTVTHFRQRDSSQALLGVAPTHAPAPPPLPTSGPTAVFQEMFRTWNIEVRLQTLMFDVLG